MLADGDKHLASRFRGSQASACLPVHADPQGSGRLTARCCGVSAESVIGCGVGVASTKAITVAEVMEKRCLASAEVVAQVSSARDAEKIERAMTTAMTDSMF
jgi:hypothetical protein